MPGRIDFVVVDAVPRNQSPGANSLVTGKITGNFSFLGHCGENLRQKDTRFQSVRSEFPKNQNRELVRQSREKYSVNRVLP
jgi:hypothetical protein